MTARRSNYLTRRDPFSDVHLFSGWPFQPLARRRVGDRSDDRNLVDWAPPVEVREDDKAYTIHLEVPGIPLEDIKIESHKDLLTIKGEKEATEVKDTETCHVTERRYGAFTRSFRVPNDSDEEKIRASYDNGVLEVVIPKREPSTPTAIPIES